MKYYAHGVKISNAALSYVTGTYVKYQAVANNSKGQGSGLAFKCMGNDCFISAVSPRLIHLSDNLFFSLKAHVLSCTKCLAASVWTSHPVVSANTENLQWNDHRSQPACKPTTSHISLPVHTVSGKSVLKDMGQNQLVNENNTGFSFFWTQSTHRHMYMANSSTQVQIITYSFHTN